MTLRQLPGNNNYDKRDIKHVQRTDNTKLKPQSTLYTDFNSAKETRWTHTDMKVTTKCLTAIYINIEPHRLQQRTLDITKYSTEQTLETS